jgi:hypothetical protein
LGEHIPKEPYEYHFPDGNATIARLLVRSLIPGAMPGHTAEDSVLANVDYSRLDRSDSQVRIRLGSTCVRARQQGKEVEIVYGRDKQLCTVRGKATILSCWNMMIPYLCPELPPNQKEALHYGVKVPLVYTVVALRNWTAFQKLGIRGAQTPGMYHSTLIWSSPPISATTVPKSLRTSRFWCECCERLANRDSRPETNSARGTPIFLRRRSRSSSEISGIRWRAF